jgi:hypothetical protein
MAVFEVAKISDGGGGGDAGDGEGWPTGCRSECGCYHSKDCVGNENGRLVVVVLFVALVWASCSRAALVACVLTH